MRFVTSSIMLAVGAAGTASVDGPPCTADAFRGLMFDPWYANVFHECLSNDLSDAEYVVKCSKDFAAEDRPHGMCARCLIDFGSAEIESEQNICDWNPSECASRVQRLATATVTKCMEPEFANEVVQYIANNARVVETSNEIKSCETSDMILSSSGLASIDVVVDVAGCLATTTPSVADCLRTTKGYASITNQCRTCLNRSSAQVSEACTECVAGTPLLEQNDACKTCVKRQTESVVDACMYTPSLFPVLRPTCNATETHHLNQLIAPAIFNPVSVTDLSAFTRNAVGSNATEIAYVCQDCLHEATRIVTAKCGFECTVMNSTECSNCWSEIANKTINVCSGEGARYVNGMMSKSGPNPITAAAVAIIAAVLTSVLF